MGYQMPERRAISHDVTPGSPKKRIKRPDQFMVAANQNTAMVATSSTDVTTFSMANVGSSELALGHASTASLWGRTVQSYGAIHSSQSSRAMLM